MSRVTGKAFLGRIILPMATVFVLVMGLASGVYAEVTRNVSGLPASQLGMGSAYHPQHDETESDDQKSDKAGSEKSDCDDQESEDADSEEEGSEERESDGAGSEKSDCDDQESEDADSDGTGSDTKGSDKDKKGADKKEAGDTPRRGGDHRTPSPNNNTPSPGGNTASPDVGSAPASCNGYTGNRQIGCTLLLQAGYTINQMSCLDRLWTKESGWNPNARNPSSGAYGIPQSLPANKMATSGSDWRTNPATQIKWGLDYIKGRYGNPCAAWNHSQRTNWY